MSLPGLQLSLQELITCGIYLSDVTSGATDQSNIW